MDSTDLWIKREPIYFRWERYEDLVKLIFEYLADVDFIGDFGSGRGNLIAMIKRNYPYKTFLCMELRKDTVKYIKTIGKSVGDSIAASVEKLPFRSNTFGGIVSTFVLDYLDKEKPMEEMRRVLKNGGKLILCFHHKESGLVDGLKNYENYKEIAKILESNMFNSWEEFSAAMNNSNFKVEKLMTYKDPITSKKLCYLAFLMK